MKKELFLKKIIKGKFPLVFAIVLISVSFQACQKDEILSNTDSEAAVNQPNLLKSATISDSDIDAVIVKIENYLNEGGLESGLANAFTVKLENAKKSLEKGNEKASTNQLQALINQLKDLVADGTIETSIGEGLIYELRLLAGETPTFTDTRDGHVYKTIKIGDQVWMAENLAYLPQIFHLSASGYSEWSPRYFVYDYYGSGTIDDYDFSVEGAKATENYATYGVLYNWPAASTASPEGWHLPSNAEWRQLANYLTNNSYGYGESVNDSIAKALAATNGWNVSETEGTPGNDMLSNNSSGFSGLPGGDIYTPQGGCHNMGEYGIWWSDSTYVKNLDYGVTWYLKYTLPKFYSAGSIFGSGFSVRCVRD